MHSKDRQVLQAEGMPGTKIQWLQRYSGYNAHSGGGSLSGLSGESPSIEKGARGNKYGGPSRVRSQKAISLLSAQDGAQPNTLGWQTSRQSWAG